MRLLLCFGAFVAHPLFAVTPVGPAAYMDWNLIPE
jgi:hypothetical protein